MSIAVNLDTTNQNFPDCIKEVDGWGVTSYQNICGGTTHEVGWGFLNYFFAVVGFGTILIIALAIVLLVVVLVAMKIDEAHSEHQSAKSWIKWKDDNHAH